MIHQPANLDVVRVEPDITLSGVTLAGSILEIKHDGINGPQATLTLRADPEGNFATQLSLVEGSNIIEIISRHSASAQPRRSWLQLFYDSDPLAFFVEINRPADGATVTESVLTVAGATLPGARVVLNDIIPAAIDADGFWTASILLRPGSNEIKAVSRYERSLETDTITVVYTPAP